MKKERTILLAAGGTGGHLFPALAFAEELQSLGHRNIHLITDLRCQKYLTDCLPLSEHIVDLHINSSGIINKIRSTFLLLKAIFKAYILVKHLKPDIIIGFGGYPSFPAMLVSQIQHIPMVIHEQNSYLGKSNKFFAKYAKQIALSNSNTINIPDYAKAKVVITGDLVRKNIKNIAAKGNFDSEPFVLFIFGGSQGAQIFSALVPEAIKILKTKYQNINIEIIQQVQNKDQQKIKQLYDDLGVNNNLLEFFFDINNIYQKAHLVIARSGASTIAELTHVGLPAIFIPLPSAADDHQYHNAMALENINASWCFKQKDISSTILAAKIYDLIINRSKLKNASSQLIQRKNDGSKNLANTVLKIIE